jgi:hypothetical protein
LHPREQKRKESGRLRQQISQVLVTPLPGLACGRPLRNTILALLITYVCTWEMSISFPTSDTRITLWYDERRICMPIYHIYVMNHDVFVYVGGGGGGGEGDEVHHQHTSLLVE